MKKKLLGVLLAGAVTASMLTACGGKETTTESAAATEQQTRQNEGTEEADSASQETEEKKAEVVEETGEAVPETVEEAVVAEEDMASDDPVSAETATELKGLCEKVIELMTIIKDADMSTVLLGISQDSFSEYPIQAQEVIDMAEELKKDIEQEDVTQAEAKELKEAFQEMVEEGEQILGVVLAIGGTVEKIPDDLLVSEATFEELLQISTDLAILLDKITITLGEQDSSGDFVMTEKSYEEIDSSGDFAKAHQTLREVMEMLSTVTPENMSEVGARWMIENYSGMIDELNQIIDGMLAELEKAAE